MNEGTPIRLPVGARDFLPRAAARRRGIAEALLAEFERWGYERIITPAFEYADVLARGLGADARAAAIRFVEPATGEVVALRPDITPQVARIAATRLADAAGPLRLCYEGAVMRLLPGARGQKELIQAGVELVGAPAPEGDAEAIALAAAALAAAGIPEVTVDVGHVALAAGAIGAIADPARRAEIRERVARKDAGGVARAAAGAKLAPKRRRVLEALPSLHGDPDAVLARARALPLSAAERAAVDDVERVLELVAEEGGEARLTVDLGEARAFEYYTGIRFACYVPGCGDAAVRGGRYDDLIGRYGRAARATGFAVDVEAVAQAEKARGVPAPAAAPGVLVVERGPVRERAFRLASALRRAGARAAVDLAPRRAGDSATLAYASGAGLRVVLILEGRRARAIAVDRPEVGARPVSAAALAAASRGTADALAVELGLLGTPRRTQRRRAGWPS